MTTTVAENTELRISPLANAEQLRREMREKSVTEHRAQLGQFLSPLPIAKFMATLFPAITADVRLLDPGAGIGSLTAAFVEDACCRKRRPTSIDVSAYEIDPKLEVGLKQTLEDCDKRCQDAGIRFTSTILIGDFIEIMVENAKLRLIEEAAPGFTHVIMNPPYKKIRSNSITRKSLSQVGIETSNLYTAFMSLAVDAMGSGGHFVSITPRSFCNGPYFKRFRKAFLDTMRLNRLHLFESRKDAFRDDAVLQENIIVSATRSDDRSREHVVVSSSSRLSEELTTNRIVPYENVVSPSDPDLFIHLAMDKNADETAKRISILPACLPETGASISTGRVIDFRAREHLRSDMDVDTVPLIYPCNMNQAGIDWPKAKTKKPQAIISCSTTSKLLVGKGQYVLVKRFTSKEENRRVVAAVFDSELIGCEWAGFENHLNFFHSDGGSLEKDVAQGLAAYLNTTTVDSYFRQFNGHTQVNASDLKKLRYPTRIQLIAIGKSISRRKKIDQGTIDAVVNNEVGWN